MTCGNGLGKSAVSNLGCAVLRNAREDDDKMFKMQAGPIAAAVLRLIIIMCMVMRLT